jgi:fibronectin-binding autotransporter adhesin
VRGWKFLLRPLTDRSRSSIPGQARAWLSGATLLFALLAARSASGSNCIWQAGSASDWSTSTANWSCAKIPGSADDVIFRGNGTGTNSSCTITSPVTVNSITFRNSYSGTVAASSNSVTVDGDWSMNTGTFTSSGLVTIAGNFTATSGFTSTGTLYLAASATGVTENFGGASLNNVQVGNKSISGLVGYWTLDETTGTSEADSSGNSNTGTSGSSSAVTHTTSVPSGINFTDARAITLDGSSNGYISVGTTNLPANNAAQSISLWFNGTTNASTNQNMFAMTSLASNSALQVGYRGTSLSAWNYGGGTLVSTAAPSNGVWHHLVYTYDGTTDSLYVDGTLAATSTTSTHQSGAVTAAYMGTYSPGNEMFAGSLDDVRVYNRALNSAEVTLLASGLSPTSVSGTHTFGDSFACSGDFSILQGSVADNTTTDALSVGGDWYNAGTYTHAGPVTLTGAASIGLITTGGANLAGLTISGGTYTLQDNLSVTGNLTISSGAGLNGSQTVSASGNFSNSGTFSATGAVTLSSGSTTATLKGGGAHFSSLSISNASGKYTLQDRLSVSGGTLSLTGALTTGSNTLRVGTITGSGTFTPTGGTVIVDGSASQTLPTSATSYGSLRIEDTTENNLVGYWKLDEAQGTVLQDSSGNGNTGTLSGSITWATQASALPGLTFDDYAQITFSGGYAKLGVNNMPATNGAITFSAWVNLTSNASNQNFLALSGGSGNLLQFGVRGTNYMVWQNGATSTLTGPSALTGWHHLAYTYNGSSVDTIYVDGTAYTGSFMHDAGATTSAWIATYSGGSESLNGAMDDVRIYDIALSASQIAQLAAGRYAGTGGIATVTLPANTTVTGLLALDDGNLNANGKTMSAGATGPTAAVVSVGTYTVGAAAQTFPGGLIVRPNGTLTLASSGGSVNLGANQTLSIDGTLNATTTGAVIQASSGTYTFTVGSSASATPTVNVSGLTVKNTHDGMQIGATSGATTTITELDNLKFSGGNGAQYLIINAKSMYLSSTGCTFDAGLATGATTRAVKVVGNGTADGETRAIFGGTTCATSWAISASDTACGTAAKSDDDANNDGSGDNPASNGAVAQMVRAAATDVAGTLIGFPTAAFDWSTFTYYSTYVTFHDASASSDVIYVRDAAGNPLYSWTDPSASETIVGTPQWTTTGGTHYLYVAVNGATADSGKVYRLKDTGTGTTSGTLTLDTAWNVSGGASNGAYTCGCTITSNLSMDYTNVYWGGTVAGAPKLLGIAQSGTAFSSATWPVTVPVTVTTSGPQIYIDSTAGTSTLYLGATSRLLQLALPATTWSQNASVGTITGRVSVAKSYLNATAGKLRVFAGDSSGTLWVVDTSAFGSVAWSYAAGAAITNNSYEPFSDTVQFGTSGGKIVALRGSGSGGPSNGPELNTSYPYTLDASDPIAAAPLYSGGVLVVGTTMGKLYFLDRDTGNATAPGGVSIIKMYSFGAGETVSTVAMDGNTSRIMVSTSSAANDGRLYYIDAVSDPTPLYQ